MAVLQTCCGCFTIQDGSMLVGLFSLLMFSVSFIGALPYFPDPKKFSMSYALNTENFKDLRNARGEVLKIIYILMTVLVSINLISSLLLLLGIKHRNRFLLLPWIIWTGLTMALSQVWMILTTTPVLMGDLLVLVLFVWAEMCVISHYQNIRDGIHEFDDRPDSFLSIIATAAAVNASNNRAAFAAASAGNHGIARVPEYTQHHFQQLVLQDGVSDPCPPSSSHSMMLQQPSSVQMPSLSSTDEAPPPYPGPPEQSTSSSARPGSLPVTLASSSTGPLTTNRSDPKMSAGTPPPSYEDCFFPKPDEDTDQQQPASNNCDNNEHNSDNEQT